MQIQAAIVWEQGAPLSVESAELDAPRAGEVLVEVKAAGVCHSDLHATSGDWPMGVPFVPGHEGAGIVRALGAGVNACKAWRSRGLLLGAGVWKVRARAGWARRCCAIGSRKPRFATRLPTGDTRLHAKGQDVAPFLGTACFASHTVVPQEGLVTVPDEVPFEALAAVGCAVVTGVGAVSNAAKIPPGAVVAVIGAGRRRPQRRAGRGARRSISHHRDRPRSRRR